MLYSHRGAPRVHGGGPGGPALNVTSWFGGLVYVDVDEGLLGKKLRIVARSRAASVPFSVGSLVSCQGGPRHAKRWQSIAFPLYDYQHTHPL